MSDYILHSVILKPRCDRYVFRKKGQKPTRYTHIDVDNLDDTVTNPTSDILANPEEYRGKLELIAKYKQRLTN